MNTISLFVTRTGSKYVLEMRRIWSIRLYLYLKNDHIFYARYYLQIKIPFFTECWMLAGVSLHHFSIIVSFYFSKIFEKIGLIGNWFYVMFKLNVLLMKNFLIENTYHLNKNDLNHFLDIITYSYRNSIALTLITYHHANWQRVTNATRINKSVLVFSFLHSKKRRRDIFCLFSLYHEMNWK